MFLEHRGRVSGRGPRPGVGRRCGKVAEARFLPRDEERCWPHGEVKWRCSPMRCGSWPVLWSRSGRYICPAARWVGQLIGRQGTQRSGLQSPQTIRADSDCDGLGNVARDRHLKGTWSGGVIQPMVDSELASIASLGSVNKQIWDRPNTQYDTDTVWESRSFQVETGWVNNTKSWSLTPACF
jgi:hypothetical protein